MPSNLRLLRGTICGLRNITEPMADGGGGTRSEGRDEVGSGTREGNSGVRGDDEKDETTGGRGGRGGRGVSDRLTLYPFGLGQLPSQRCYLYSGTGNRGNGNADCTSRSEEEARGRLGAGFELRGRMDLERLDQVRPSGGERPP